MDINDSITKQLNFGIKKLDNEKVLIQIPFGIRNWEGEYDLNDPISKIFNDFKDKNGVDISDNFLKNIRNRKVSIDINDRIQTLLDNIHIFNENMISNLVGKPFNNPFEVFVFDKSSKILNIQAFDENQIKSLGLNYYSPSSAYCNGNNHLFISGGEQDGNQIIDKFFDIDLKTNNIDGPYIISPKKNHSMVFISPEKVFIVGGNDTKSFYFDTNEKTIIDLKDLNIIRAEPALQIIGNILYCFDNINKADNERLSFEKIDISDPNAEWELIYPTINQPKFPQKFFAVSKDNTGENIIFLGGNMDDNVGEDELKNYQYNPEFNLIDQTNIPFHGFNYKEKTFLSYNKNVDYLLPDFNRQHPEVTFYVKNKGRFEKVNYLPQEDSNVVNINIQRNKYHDNKYNFNMPEIQTTNMEIQDKTDLKKNFEDDNNLKGIEEPSFNNNIDKDLNIEIKQDPPFKEANLDPIKGDQQINIDIPNNLEEFTKLKDMFKNRSKINEEEKNAEEDMKDTKLGDNVNPNKNSFRLINYNYNNAQQNDTIPAPYNEEEVKKSTLNLEGIQLTEFYNKLNSDLPNNINPELQIKDGNINIEGENTGFIAPNIHLPKQEETNLDEIKKNALKEKQININIKGPETKLNENELEIKGNLLTNNTPDATIKTGKDIKAKIPGGNLDRGIKDSKINIPETKTGLNINMKAKQNPDFFLGGTIGGNKDSKESKEFIMYGIIKGNEEYNKNKIKVTKGEVTNINYATGINGINATTNLKGPNIPGKDVNVEINSPGINSGKTDIKKPGVNLQLDSNIPNTELNMPNIESKKIGIEINENIPNIDVNKPKIDIKLEGSKNKNQGTDYDLSGIIPGNISQNDLNVKGSRRLYGSNMDLDLKNGNLKAPKILYGRGDNELKGSRRMDINIDQDIKGGNFSSDLKSPKLNTNLDVKGDINVPKIDGPNLKMDIKSPETKNANINIKTPTIYKNITGTIPAKKTAKANIKIPETKLKGDLSGKANLNIDQPKIDIKGPKIETDKNIDINLNKPGITIPSGNLDVKTPKINGSDFELKGEIPGKKIKRPKLHTDVELDIKGPKANIPELKKPDIKGPNVNIEGNLPNVDIKGQNEVIISSGIIQGTTKLDKPKLKVPGVKIDGNIKGPNIDKPNLDIDIKNKEFDIKQNINDVNINPPELNMPSGNFNLKGKAPNFSLEGNLPKTDIDINKENMNINANIPDVNIESNMPKANIEGIIPNIDVDVNKPKLDIDAKLPNIDLDMNNPKLNIDTPKIDSDIKKPELDMNLNIPKMDIEGKIGTDMPNFNINNNIPSGELNIDAKKPNLELNSPRIDLPSGGINLKGGIPEIDASIKKPEFEGLNANLKGPNIDINKPKIDVKGNIDLKGDIKGIDVKKPNIELPKADIEVNKKDFELTGVIPGYASKDINIKGSRIMPININEPEIKIKSSKYSLEQPDINLKGSRRLDIPSTNLDANLKGSRMLNAQINSPDMNIPSGNLNIKGPKIESSNLKNIDIKGKNINIDGNIPNPELNIKGKDEIIISSGIIPGTKKLKKPELKVPDVKIDGKIKGPKINVPNIDKPNLDIDIKNKEFDIKQNINDVNINPPELNMPSGNFNLKGKAPNFSLEGNLPKTDIDINKENMNINANIPDVNIESNMPKANIEGIIPNIDVDVNKPKLNTNANKLNFDLGIKEPNLDMNAQIPNYNINGEIGGNMPNIDINNNIPSGELNIEAKKPNLEINSPKIEIPSGDINLKTGLPGINIDGNIENKDIKVPEIDASIKKPELKGIKTNLKGPNIDINKPKIDVKGNIDLKGDIKGIDVKKPNIELPKADIEVNKKDFELTGVIPGYASKDINIKGSRIMPININEPEIKIKSSKYSLEQPDINLKGSRRLDIPSTNLDANLKGSRALYNTQINPNSKISFNKGEVDLNSPKIDINAGDIKLNSKKTEIKKNENEIFLTGIIGGNKSYNKNQKINLNTPKLEIQGKLDNSNTLKKEENKTGTINPSMNQKVNIEVKNYNLLSGQKIDAQLPNIEIKNATNELDNNIEIKSPEINNNIEIKMPEIDANVDINNKKDIGLDIDNENQDHLLNIELNKDGLNQGSEKGEVNNKLFSVNINGNLGENAISPENSNIRMSQNAKKRGLPLVGSKKTEFKASKIGVAGKLDVNEVDISNMKSANVAVNGVKMGDRIVE